MKYKINYWYEGTTKLLSKVMEATDEKAAIAIFHDVYGSNRNCEILNINPQACVESESPIKSSEPTDNLIKRSEEEKQQEALSYFDEADILLDPTSSETLSRPDRVAASHKQVDNSINEVTKDKLTFFGLGLLYWIALSPMIISGAVWASAYEYVIMWPLLTIVGMMASPLWLFLCWGSSCTQPNQDVLVILSWIIWIELITISCIASIWAANSSKDT